MALIACPECGTQVSSLAVACPKCAAPIAGAAAANAVGQQVVTTEQTAKKFKRQQALGAVGIIVGMLLLFSGGTEVRSDRVGLNFGAAVGLALAIVGLGLVISAKIRAWWHHG